MLGLFDRKEKIRLRAREMHCHLLPGVDDGFDSAEKSLLAIERMARAGVKEITFTPHMNPEVYPDGDEAHFREVYDEFSKTIPSGVKTHLAAEYMVVRDFHLRAGKGDLLAYEDGSVLIEMSYLFKSPNIEEAVFALVSAGYGPILAHPERYPYMAGNLAEFERLHDMGCRFQMNWMSLSGAYGPASMRILKFLLHKDLYSFVATDLHSLDQLDLILSLKAPSKLLELLP